MNVYNAALKCAEDKLNSYAITQSARLTKFTPDQLAAVRVMIADAWLCGYDAAETRPTSTVTGGSNAE